jgi:hypothetical protein
MPFALLYISRNRVPEERHADELARILDVSLRYNKAHSITGALVSTPQHYAQIIEGPRTAVGALMKRIEADPGHGDISIVVKETLPQRSFARWSLAHIGTSDELEQAIGKFTNVAGQGPAPGDVWSLWNLMSALAHRQSEADPSRAT